MFAVAKRVEVDFLCNKTVSSIPLHQTPYDVEHQARKGVLAVNISLEDESVT